MADRIGTYFTKKHNQLNKLVLRAGGLRSLEGRFLARIDPGLKDHIRLTRISREELTLLTDSAARTNQLRFMVPQFLAIFHDLLGNEDLRQIHILTGNPSDFIEPSPSPRETRKSSREKPRQLAQLKQLLEEKKPR